MSLTVPRVLAAAIGLACGAIANAAPIVIDSEQKAASAVVGATSVLHLTPYYHSLITSQIVLHANIALSSVNSATTPAALMATPAGITIPCATSGYLQARMARTKPRVLKFAWHDCHFLQFGWPYSLDGPGEIALIAETFAPTTVASIRFGDLHTDLVQTRDVVTPDQTNHDTLLRNLRITGVIPMSGFQRAGTVTQFGYVITGFIDEKQEISFPTRAPETYRSRTRMEALTYLGSLGYDSTFTVVTNELRVLLGELSFESQLPPPYTGGTERFRYENLRVLDVVDFGANWDRTATLDGKVDYQWFTLRRPGCLSGGYSFRSFAPLHASLNDVERFDAGEIGINNKVRSSYFSAVNVPPGLPVPTQGVLIHNEVAGVGTFNYDVSSVRVGLHPVSGCDG